MNVEVILSMWGEDWNGAMTKRWWMPASKETSTGSRSSRMIEADTDNDDDDDLRWHHLLYIFDYQFVMLR